jgi:hypothetical protein
MSRREATGITIYLENGGTLETAQKIAAHESPQPNFTIGQMIS